MAADREEHVVDVVRESAGKGPDALHALEGLLPLSRRDLLRDFLER